MTRSQVGIFALVLLAGITSLAGAKRELTLTSEVTIIAPNEIEDSIIVGDRRVSLETGVPIALYNPDYRVASGSPESMVLAYLDVHQDLFRLRDETLDDLVHHHTRSGDVGHTVRYTQSHEDVPVYESDFTITVDKNDTVIFVMNTYKSQLDLEDVTPVLTPEAARAIALQHISPEGGLTLDKTTLMVYHAEGTSHLVYRVQLMARVSPIGDWDILVDAKSGVVVKAIDRSHYVDGAGNMWDPDPLGSAGAQYGDPGFVDGGDADTPELNAQIVTYALPDITDTGLSFRLIGPWAEIVDTEGPFEGTYDQSTADGWTVFNRTDQEFEAALCYWHIDNYMRYINLTLGTTCVPFQYVGGAKYDPHGLNGADNSHYTSSTGVVAFGDGGVDDSGDADVVLHELGHAIHDWLTVGGLSQVNGLSEGFGDYVAASYSRSLGQWTPADPEYQWVFSWDGHNPFWPGRRTNHTASYPGGLTGSIHTDGQIFSTCMMRIWDRLGQQATDKAVFEGLAMTNGGTSQLGAAQAILDAAVALDYPLEDQLVFFDEMRATGYAVDSPVAVNGPTPAVTFDLAVNPNPFNPRTTVSYEITEAGRVSVSVFDIAGRQVAELVNGSLTPGQYSVTWDGRDDLGNEISSGVYAIRVTSGGKSESRQTVLLK